MDPLYLIGIALQNFMDGLGIKYNDKGPYMRGLRAEIDAACKEMFDEQRNIILKRLQRKNGKITIIVDGTYSQRGHNSQDCFVTIMVEIEGQKKPFIISYCYKKRTWLRSLDSALISSNTYGIEEAKNLVDCSFIDFEMKLVLHKILL